MISRDGYRMGAKGYNDPFKIIPGMSGIGTNISMLEDDGAPLRKGPLFLEDNFGNFDIGIPGMERIDFAGDYVKETPIKSRDAYSDLLKLVSQRNEERKRLGPTAQPNLATGGSVHNKYLPKAQAGSETDSTNSQKLNTLLISRIEAKRAALAAEKEAALAAEEANKVPVVESAQPVTQPAQPVVQPVVQPVQRVVQPAPPVTPPVQPAVQPITQPVAQPVQPTAPPVQPVQSIEPVPTESVSQTAAEAAAEAAVKAVANKAAAESVEPAPNLQGVIEMENPIEGSEDFPNLLQPLDISWRGNLNKKDFELMPKGDQTNVWMDGVGMIGEHTLDGGDYRTIQQKIDDIHKQIEGLNDQIQGLTYISTDPNLGEASTQAKKEIAKIEDGQQQLIDEINQIKRNYAGNFDTWASNELSPTISKPLQKWGLIDQYSPSRLEKPVFETYEERAEKEKIAAEKTREELITTNSHDEINPSDNAWYRWQYRTSASNDDPLTVKIYGTRKERSGNSLNIKSKGSIMHFLDQSPLSGFMHNKTKVFYKNSKADDYFGYLKANEDGTHQVMYKKKKDIPADELYKNTFLVRQNDFDAINFNGRHIDRNFDGHTYWSLKGTNYKDPIDLKWKERPAIPISAGIDHNTYDYSSGQTVVYIFQYKDKTRYVHFAGSPNAIKKEGDRIKKEYDLKKNDLKIGVADAGSYSSSVKGNITNDLLNSKDYGYYNMSGNTGAGMALIEKKVGGELKKLKKGGETEGDSEKRKRGRRSLQETGERVHSIFQPNYQMWNNERIENERIENEVNALNLANKKKYQTKELQWSKENHARELDARKWDNYNQKKRNWLKANPHTTYAGWKNWKAKNLPLTDYTTVDLFNFGYGDTDADGALDKDNDILVTTLEGYNLYDTPDLQWSNFIPRAKPPLPREQGAVATKNYKYRVAETPWKGDVQKGNQFREWINTEYPELASEWKIEKEGDPNDARIRSAYWELGQDYGIPEMQKKTLKRKNNIIDVQEAADVQKAITPRTLKKPMQSKIVTRQVWMGQRDREGNKIYEEQSSRIRERKVGGELPKAQIGGTEWNEYTMSLNSPEAWSDKIRHTEQNDSDNTQQVLKEYAMWRKSNDWVHDNKKPKDPFNINEYQAIPRPEQLQTPSMEDQVYSRFPALRNMGEVTFKADPEFTREATGIGDIEYFGPGEDRTQITYPNSFVYPHPKVGTHGIVYNPETNNAQSIALDMLHGLGKDDKNYEKLRNKFGESYMNSIFREDFERDVKMFKEEIGEDKFNEWYDDDKDYFNQSYVDGIIRNLLFEGSPEDFKESRYWEGAREGYLSQPGLKETFNALEGYLKTPTKKHGGELPKAQIWNSAIKGGRRLLGLGDDAVNYEKNAIINEWKLLNNAAKPISKSSSIAGKTFNSADELRAAFHQKNAADLSGAKLSPSPELVSAIEANVPSSAPFFSQLDYHGARLAKDSQTITKKGSSYNYPKTVHTLAQQYEKMPTLNSAGFPVYFHGTGSASIPGILKQKGLVPYGQLKNSGLTPMTGEMSGVSLGNKSVNTDHLSTTFIENLQDPIRYAGAFSKNKRDIFGDYGNFMKNITQYTNEYGIEKATRMKEFYTTQLEDFLRLSDYEQALVKENYPVMFGFNPTKATSLGGNRFKIPSMSDIRAEGAIRGKIGWDEVAGMFVPKTKMGLTQDMVGNNIKVGNLDEIVRGTFNLNDARKYKWNQGGESSRVQFRDWFKNAYS